MERSRNANRACSPLGGAGPTPAGASGGCGASAVRSRAATATGHWPQLCPPKPSAPDGTDSKQYSGLRRACVALLT